MNYSLFNYDETEDYTIPVCRQWIPVIREPMTGDLFNVGDRVKWGNQGQDFCGVVLLKGEDKMMVRFSEQSDGVYFFDLAGNPLDIFDKIILNDVPLQLDRTFVERYEKHKKVCARRAAQKRFMKINNKEKFGRNV